MTYRIEQSETIKGGTKYKQDVCKTVSKIYEVIFKNDDINFEDIIKPVNLHIRIDMMETKLGNNENEIKNHLLRALELVKKSIHIEEHTSTLPLLQGLKVLVTPANSKKMVIINENISL